MSSLVLGSARAQFTITLSAAASEPVSVDWFTTDGTALAGRDYETNSGTVLFAPGEVTKTVEVFVHGRTVETEDRVFYVRMLPPVNAILADEVGACVIHVDTTGSQPVMTVVIPKGEKGERGYSAYEIALQNGFVGTEAEWLESLKPSPAEVALEVAPLLVADNMPVTAKGTETLTPKDTDTLAGVAGRIPYVPLARKAIAPALSAGVNMVPLTAFIGDAIDPSHLSGFNVIAMRAGKPVDVNWSYLPASSEVQITDGQAGDIPIAVNVSVGDGKGIFKRFADIASSIGASLVGISPSGFAEFIRTVESVLKERISIKDYGAVGDGMYRPVSDWYTVGATQYRGFANLAAVQAKFPHVTSPDDSIDWAATQAALNAAKAKGEVVHGPEGAYVINRTVIQPPGVTFVGEGQMESPSTPQDFVRLFELRGTAFLYYGTGPKVHKADLAATDGTTTGEVFVNVSSYEPGYDSRYAKASFWNNDADPATGAPATQKLFSCGWKVELGGFSKMINCSLIPWHGAGGVSGYNAGLPVWGDDWDTGLWVDNHHDFYCENVSVIGYWRMAGCFGRTSLPGGDPRSPDWERNKFVHCIFQGWSSFLLRGSDLFDIKAVGADWIEIEWFDSHPFDPAFDNTFRTQEYGGLFCSYTGTTKVGSNLRITGVTPSPAAIDPANSANKVILGRRTNGVADASWDNCYFYGMNHRLYRATSAAFGAARYNNPSRCIEISGANIRGLKFNDTCKVMSGDDIGLYLGNVLQLQYDGSFESKNVEGRGSGIRNVAGSNAYQIVLGQDLRGTSGIDMRPAYPTTDGRFTTPGDPGLFSPNQVMWHGWTYGIDGHVDIRPGAGQRVAFCDANGVPVLFRSPTGEYRLLDVSGATVARFNPTTDTWTHTADNHVIAARNGESRFTASANDASINGEVVRIYNKAGTLVIGRFDSTSSLLDFAGIIRPDADNTRSLGAAARRFTTVYASNTTISSSDGRLKTPIRKLTLEELAAGLELGAELGIWQWLERVSSEGDDARLHCGMSVQRAIEIMESHGLDPMAYGFICYDAWPDEWEDRPAIVREDEEGNSVEVAPAERVLVTAAGDLYSFRMNELQAFILAAQFAEQAILNTKLADAVARIESLEQRAGN